VKLGVRNGGVAQVLEGVSAGDRVVTKGAQPISHRIDHMLSGTLANIAVKIFGDDLHELRRLGKEVQAAMIGVPGVVDLSLEQQTEIPTLRIKPDPASAARFGLAAGEVAERIETVLVRREVGRILEGSGQFSAHYEVWRRSTAGRWRGPTRPDSPGSARHAVRFTRSIGGRGDHSGRPESELHHA
jgi:Cu/Ag efflux pump CusA